MTAPSERDWAISAELSFAWECECQPDDPSPCRACWLKAEKVAEIRREARDEARREQIETLVKLVAEVGALRAFEHEVRAAIGNTNWSVLMLRRDEAEAAIRAQAQGGS